MSGRWKVVEILNHIKRESEINPDPKWVDFRFNTSVVGQGILNDDQERRILLKLEKENVLEIHLPNPRNEEEEAMLSSYMPIEFMMESNGIRIKILPAFYRKYFWYKLTSLDENVWNIVNPFWILWKLVRGITSLIEWLWSKSKVTTLVIGGLGGIVVYDWSLAWRNVGIVLEFFKIL